MIETEDSLISPPQRHPADSTAVCTASVSLAEDDADFQEIVIQPQSGWIAIDWKEMFAYRELLIFLIKRDISVRYKQTVLGRCMGDLAPLTADADLHVFLRAVRQDPLRRCSLPGVRLRGANPLDPVLARFLAVRAELGQSTEPTDQGVLPSPVRPDGGCFRIPGRRGLLAGHLRIRVVLLPRHGRAGRSSSCPCWSW